MDQDVYCINRVNLNIWDQYLLGCRFSVTDPTSTKMYQNDTTIIQYIYTKNN